MPLPDSVKSLPIWLAKIFEIVFEDEVGCGTSAEEAETKAFALVQFYQSNPWTLGTEYAEPGATDARSILIPLIFPRPGEPFEGERGPIEWTVEKSTSALQTFRECRDKGYLPAIYFGDHGERVFVAWAVDMLEVEIDGASWLAFRPLFVGDAGRWTRDRIISGELRYASLEVYSSYRLDSVDYAPFISGTVILDPAGIPAEFPAVPGASLLVASIPEQTPECNRVKIEFPASFLGAAPSSVTPIPDEPSGLTPDDLMSALDRMANALRSNMETTGDLRTRFEAFEARVASLESRIQEAGDKKPDPPVEDPAETGETSEEEESEETSEKAPEKPQDEGTTEEASIVIQTEKKPPEEPEETEDEVRRDVARTLDMLQSEDAFLVGLSPRVRAGAEEYLASLPKAERTAAIGILEKLERTDLRGRTRGDDPEKAKKLEAPEDPFSVPVDDPKRRGDLRALSIRRIQSDALKTGKRLSTIEATELSTTLYPHLWT